MNNAEYKWKLNSKIGKFICPSCGHKKRFVRYTDEKGNLHPDETVGKCDRINKCNYWKKPSDSAISLRVENVKNKDKQPNYINYDAATLLDLHNNLMQSKLYQVLSKIYDKDKVMNTLINYRVGAIKIGNIMYDCLPYINYKGEITTIQAKSFDERLHTIKNTWHHTLVNDSFTQSYKNNDKFIRCFFGEHLLKNDNYNKICIVEAAKTAIVCSLEFYDNDNKTIWLAAFNASGLTEEKIKVLYNLKKPIVLCPDASENGHVFESWQKVADTLKRRRIACFTYKGLEKLDLAIKSKGVDLADIILKKYNL